MSTLHLPAGYTFTAPSALHAGLFLSNAASMLRASAIHIQYTTVLAGSTEVKVEAILTHATVELLQKIARSMPHSAQIAETLALKTATPATEGGVS